MRTMMMIMKFNNRLLKSGIIYCHLVQALNIIKKWLNRIMPLNLRWFLVA